MDLMSSREQRVQGYSTGDFESDKRKNIWKTIIVAIDEATVRQV